MECNYFSGRREKMTCCLILVKKQHAWSNYEILPQDLVLISALQKRVDLVTAALLVLRVRGQIIQHPGDPTGSGVMACGGTF